MRSQLTLALGAILALFACATPTAVTPSPSAPYVVAAVAAASRPDADRARDVDRKPAEMLAFAGVRPGQHVADFIPGGGYFTRLFSEAVGASGHVYALIPPSPPDATAEPPIKAVAAQYKNVSVVQQSFVTLSVPEPLDLIWTSQNYHDLHLARFKLDVASVNKQIFNALKPGGVYVVLDHSARAGAEIGVADTLHRIDQAIVRRELEAAGFVYDGESDVLRNPADTRELPVFDPSIRGHTDQFILRFRRPG